MRFSQRIFGTKNISQVGQNIVSFGLNSSSGRVKDGQMSPIKGLLHSPKKCKCDSCSLALPPQGACNYATVQVVKTGITLQLAPSERLWEAEMGPLHPAGPLHIRR